MAAGNDGANTPENDDPFGYLYEDGQAAGAQPPQGGGYGYPGPAQAQPGVPRTSYNQVRTVGERQYGQPPQGQQPYVPPQQQASYGQPQAQYAAPETYGGQPPRQAPPQQHHGGSGRGPNTKGLLIGAVAVVAVVVIAITAAVISNSGNKDDKNGQAGGTTPTAPSTVSEKPTTEPSPDKTQAELPKQDAATLKLGGAASLSKDVKGAKGADGAYVTFNGVGGSASWSVNVPDSGEYTLRITYGVPGKDAKTTLTVNGEPPRGVNMSNFAKAAEGDWEKGWTYTYAYVNLKKGDNALKISCEAGDTCEAILDQVYLEAGHTGR
ncbi:MULTISPECIES: CBM35 domain-containing protein [unclassified Streptomyces]|uniref:CBM35 domain-containing protein n=1 Tax=unclassified Streptomyces TaxID=2593676 RepID=UPI0006F7E2EB|nr:MULTISPECIES: CBM35 domain-containing protein [unclassified Streptomyces]KQX59494.1 carbohydrate-binding protein [Streptomyces sp. Root1304]KRB00753.1 carbohydrate-binding protein [Streptomyces sp. Root66D1]